MPQPVSITVWSDYVCPWCYVGLTELGRLRTEWDFTVDWRPFLLRPEAPDEGWPLPAYIREKMADPNNPLTARAATLGLKLVHREHIPSSRRAHEATEFARAHDRLDAFHHAVLERYWSQGKDLHQWDTLREAAVEAGLDPDAMQKEVAAGAWKPAMQEGLAAATEIGVSAVPTFIVGEKFVIQGAQDGRVFRQAFERLGARPRAA